MNFIQIGNLAHALESLFNRLKDTPEKITEEIITLTDSMSYCFNQALDTIEKTGTEPILENELNKVKEVTNLLL
jgi:chemotaxis protein histidine kinase CheA